MYETFFHLTGKPFQLNPDPGFYFPSKGHSRAFAYLKYGVHQGEGFIVITGEIGAGKTTMVRTLVEELDTDRILAAQLSSTQLDADDLVQAVASAFGLAIKGLSKAETLSQFEAFLSSLTTQDRRALLIVDEAQNLAPRAMEELRMLSNFQSGTRALLQSFLIGQPELRDSLLGPSMEQLRQRVIASYHLGPMDKKETRAYVFHRLERVGWQGDPQLDEAVFDRLFEATGGLPRMINAVCNRLLLGAFMDEKHVIGLAEFNETITEMRNEIGSEARTVLPRTNGRAAPSDNGASVSRPLVSSALTARLDRIEKSVATAVELLQQIHPQEAPPRTGAASAMRPPPRFGTRLSRP